MSTIRAYSAAKGVGEVHRRPVRRTASVIIASLSFLAAACGSRVVPLSSSQPGAAFTDQGTGIATAGPLASATPGAAAQIPGGAGGVTNAVQRLNATCKPPAASTDTGVTQTTIKIGDVVGRTGPLPKEFDPAYQATDSYFRMINDLGGICGRKVNLLIRDDGENGNTDLQVSTDLATKDKVFAFVGSVSAPNDSGIGSVSVKYRIPDIGFPLTFPRSESKYTYGVPGQLQNKWIGDGGNGTGYLNQKYGIKQVAVFWVNEADVSRMEAWGFEAAMQKRTGGHINVCYEQPTTVIDNSFTQYVVNMQSACKAAGGPIAVYTTMDNANNIKLATAMREQQFKPTIFVPTFSSYLQSFITDAEGATEGAYIPMPQIPFERLQLPQSAWTPGTYELKRYLDALHVYYPKAAPPGSFGGAGWGAAELFTEAAIACGAQLTRTCLFAQLDSMGPFSDQGFLAPTRPRDHNIYTPETLMQVRGHRFVEVEHPGVSGPPGIPDFWLANYSTLFNWWDYYCAFKSQFTNTAQKDAYIKCPHG